MGSLRRWAMDRADFALGICLGLALIVLILLIAFSQSVRLSLFGTADFQKSTAPALIAALATLTLTVVAGIVKVTAARQSLSSLITSEIRAIQYGILTMDMFDFWDGFTFIPRVEHWDSQIRRGRKIISKYFIPLHRTLAIYILARSRP